MKLTGLSPPMLLPLLFYYFLLLTSSMRNHTFHKIAIYTTLLFSLTSFNGKKNLNDSFCKVNRSIYKSVIHQQGMIGYYNKYNRWAIYTKVDYPHNIDSKIVGLVCDLPTQLQVDGLTVEVNGEYKKFNNAEGITPQMGGEELYYFKITKISKIGL